MAYASNSFGGGCPPTYLVSAISSSAMSATFSNLTGWVEVDSTGAKTSQPLGTSGSFCIKLDYGLATEETVKCTSLNPSTGVITFATRGFDGTTAQAHTAGSSSKLNVFPTETATDWVNLQATATTASTTASSALSAASAAQATANAALPKAGGTMTGALNGTTATFSGEVTGTDFKATGLTGATAASRYVGGTTSGAPTSGTFLVGDFVVDQTATIWVCITAGTPGTWSPTESQNVRSTGSSTTAISGEIIIVTGASTGVLITLPTSAVGGSTFGVVNNNNNSISIKGGTYPLLIAGTNYGAGISYTVSTNGVYLFVFDNVANRWICTSTNDIGDMVNYSDVTLDKFGAPAANLPMNAKKITGLADGTASTDAAAFGQVSVKANSATTISTTAPLSGGGDLSANRTLTIADATTAVKGAVQLTDSISSTSTTTAATPNSVKTAYDLANGRGVINAAWTQYNTTSASLVSTLALAVQMGTAVTISGFTVYLVTFTNHASSNGVGTANSAINYGFQWASGAATVVSGGGYQTCGQLITTSATRITFSYNTILVMSNTGAATMTMAGYLGGTGNTLSVNDHQLSIVGIA